MGTPQAASPTPNLAGASSPATQACMSSSRYCRRFSLLMPVTVAPVSLATTWGWAALHAVSAMEKLQQRHTELTDVEYGVGKLLEKRRGCSDLPLLCAVPWPHCFR